VLARPELVLVIDHGGGLATAYGHNSSIAVGNGQSVAQGHVIAYAGSTGNSTGPHVHFEVRVNGAAVDPLGYLG
jgi:murein DD-endopeptidase MepM/ murein hydrolase activator NlpD